MPAHLLAIDQGTTSTRAIIYDDRGQPRASTAHEFTQHYPKPGWVEHDPEEIWKSVAMVVTGALQSAKVPAKDITAIGITNQRETVVLWDRETGHPVAPAIVWQDRRTTDFCRKHQSDEEWIYRRTGLVIDPYFSATKIHWLLEQDTALRRRAEDGKIAFGTIDSWLIWNLTGKKQHLTDLTNASRTLLLDIQSGSWDDELCKFFDVPAALLPDVRKSSADFGTTHGLTFLPDGLPIAGVAGDQQSALFGQCGFSAGEAKCTYGTGAFFLQHCSKRLTHSEHRLLASIAAGTSNELEYVLEGSVFVAGAAVQWLRDGLKLFSEAPLVEKLANESDLNQPILFVPGMVGLGTPYWVPEARGTIFGLTRSTSAADLARATLEGVAFQIADLVDAAGKDSGQPLKSLRVDGGMAQNVWFLQCQADILGIPVQQSINSEATALGAAYLAGLQMGVWPDVEALRKLPRETVAFEPNWTEEKRSQRMTEWRKAIKAVIEFYTDS